MSPDRYDERLARTMTGIGEAGLRGLLVTPGANLGYLTGYAPMPLERLTVLVLAAGREPVMLVPMLERPAALTAPVGERIEIVGWTDADDPYALTARLLGASERRRGRRRIRDLRRGVGVARARARACRDDHRARPPRERRSHSSAP